MAIITFGSTPGRGVSALVTLNKTELASLSSVSGNAYYSDQSNWTRVILYYESSNSRQKEVVTFDASESSPIGTFLVSDKSRGNFLIKTITIEDKDDGYFQILRSELNVVDFDVLF